LYWGTSEWSAVQIEEAYQIAADNNLYAPTMEQPQYNLFYRDRVEKEYDSLYKEHGMGTTIWSPTGSGLLTGKYNDVTPDDTRISRQGMEWLKERLVGPDTKSNLEKVKKFTALAKELGTTGACLSIAWVIKNPNVSTAILGASKVEQLEENLKAMDVLAMMSDDVMKKIESIFR
jgi:aryl-alcohol dehydrogenase-like predicted oxidoreductase